VKNRNNIVYLGEGDTPLLPQPRLGEALGVPRLATKAEGLNPTGSFKARGMAVAVSRALELGVTTFIAPSAGNAAGALAAFPALLPEQRSPCSRQWMRPPSIRRKCSRWVRA